MLWESGLTLLGAQHQVLDATDARAILRIDLNKTLEKSGWYTIGFGEAEIGSV